MRKLTVLRMLLGVAVLTALVVGAIPLATDVQAGACRCPMIYAPVQCDHGKTFPNQCVADCHRAKNCVPLPLY